MSPGNYYPILGTDTAHRSGSSVVITGSETSPRP
jgi:hypothetical protein